MSDNEFDGGCSDSDSESESGFGDANNDSEEQESEVDTDEEDIESEDEDAGDDDDNGDEDAGGYGVTQNKTASGDTKEENKKPSEFEKAFTKAMAEEAAKGVGDLRKIATKQVEKQVEELGTTSKKSDEASTNTKTEKVETKPPKEKDDDQPDDAAKAGDDLKVTPKEKKKKTKSSATKDDDKSTSTTVKKEAKPVKKKKKAAASGTETEDEDKRTKKKSSTVIEGEQPEDEFVVESANTKTEKVEKKQPNEKDDDQPDAVAEAGDDLKVTPKEKKKKTKSPATKDDDKSTSTTVKKEAKPVKKKKKAASSDTETEDEDKRTKKKSSTVIEGEQPEDEVVVESTNTKTENEKDRGGSSFSNYENFGNSLSVSELKKLLDKCGVDYRDCIEKRDLVKRLIDSQGSASSSYYSGYRENGAYIQKDDNKSTPITVKKEAKPVKKEKKAASSSTETEDEGKRTTKNSSTVSEGEQPEDEVWILSRDVTRRMLGDGTHEIIDVINIRNADGTITEQVTSRTKEATEEPLKEASALPSDPEVIGKKNKKLPEKREGETPSPMEASCGDFVVAGDEFYKCDCGKDTPACGTCGNGWGLKQQKLLNSGQGRLSADNTFLVAKKTTSTSEKKPYTKSKKKPSKKKSTPKTAGGEGASEEEKGSSTRTVNTEISGASTASKESRGKANNASSSSAKLTPTKKRLEDVVNNDIDLYFWNVMGKSFMGCLGRLSPPMLQKDASKSAKFRIVWVDADASKVAIMSAKEEGYEQYVSCGKKLSLTNSALGGFSSRVGKKETFTMMHCKADNTFLFQAYNHLYLHYNETFHSVAFKACSERDKNDVPTKGRWTLLLEDEKNRVGEKSGMTQIAYQTTVGWAVAPVKTVLFL